MEIRYHSIDLRLLEHDFGNMNCIWIFCLSPWKFSSVFVVSWKDILLYCLNIHKHQHNHKNNYQIPFPYILYHVIPAKAGIQFASYGFLIRPACRRQVGNDVTIKKTGMIYTNFFYKENNNTIVSMIRTVAINRNFVRNVPLMVLWRNACIPRIAPTHPPSPVYRRRFFSDTLRFCACDFRLSTHRTMKVKILIRSIYQISTLVRVIFIRSECKTMPKADKFIIQNIM